MDGRTDGQGDSYITPQTLFAVGIKTYIINKHGLSTQPLKATLPQKTYPLFISYQF
jgi:hypothetical protein